MGGGGEEGVAVVECVGGCGAGGEFGRLDLAVGGGCEGEGVEG